MMTGLLPQTALTIAALIGGIFVGRLHFRVLRQGTDALIRQQAMRRALGFTLLRFAVTIAFLVAIALAGTAPLVAGAVGFGLGRALELRAARRLAEETP